MKLYVTYVDNKLAKLHTTPDDAEKFCNMQTQTCTYDETNCYDYIEGDTELHAVISENRIKMLSYYDDEAQLYAEENMRPYQQYHIRKIAIHNN